MAGTVGTAGKRKISSNPDFADFGGAFGVSDPFIINPSSSNPTLIAHSVRRSLLITLSRSGIAAVSDTRADKTVSTLLLVFFLLDGRGLIHKKFIRQSSGDHLAKRRKERERNRKAVDSSSLTYHISRMVVDYSTLFCN
jgi:hypothetical protein